MKILLVDDDSSIIQALLPALKSLPGHEVHVALSSEKAIERIAVIGDVDLLITDIVMGEMDGFSLREQLKAWFPEMRAIFISGYDLSEYSDRMRGALFLAKPFGPEEMLAMVQTAIDGTAHATAVVTPEVVQEPVAEEIAPPPPETVIEPEPAAAEVTATAAKVEEPLPEPAAELSATDVDGLASVLPPPEAAPKPAAPISAEPDTMDLAATAVEDRATHLAATDKEEVPPAAAPSESAAPAAKELDPVVHSAAPQGGSPSVAETTGLADLAKGSFDAGPNLGGHAVTPEPPAVAHLPETEPVPEEPPAAAEEAEPPVAAEPEPPAPEPPAPVPVARPVAVPMKPTTRTVSSFEPAPTLRVTATPAAATPKAVATPRATAAPGSLLAPTAANPNVPSATPTAATPTVRPAGTVPVARAVAATPTAVPVAQTVAATPTSVPVARPVAATPTAVPSARPVAATPAAVPVARPVAATPTAVPVAQPVAASPTAVPVAKPVVTSPTAVPSARPVAATPAAVSVARPVAAAPAAVPVAKAVAATPTAVPVAQTAAGAPTAVPVARAAAATPTAVPSARPVAATPTAVPSARPVAATPAAVPSARPVAATPAAVPTAKAATPAAIPTAKPAGAVPVAKASAVPTAKPGAGAPVKPVAAAARPVGAPARPHAFGAPAAVPPPPQRESHSSSAGLIGQIIGGYKIVSQLGEGRWGSVFSAVQTSINRPVGLKVLDPSRAADEAQKLRFIADARAKAHVQHPGILSVYEAGSAENWTFYTHEYVDGQNLQEMASTGRKIDEPTALKLLKTAADGLAYFEKNSIPHTPFQASDIYLGLDGQPRLSNLATQMEDQPVSMPEEIESLGRALLSVIDPTANISTALRALLGRTLRTNPSAIADWIVFLQGVKALEPKIIPLEAAKISAQERAALATVEKARAQQRRALLWNVGALVSLLLLGIATFYFVWIRTNERTLDAQIHIPAGEFVSGEGKNSSTGEFWIDKYEVTIGQYAKFVRWLDKNSGPEHRLEMRAFDHPKQPSQLNHIPEYWNIYFGQAQQNGAAHSAPIDLNSPMLTVTWWDAYAYAKWLGRELPTELEWEKAARGLTGFAFPWGEEADPRKANTNADYNARDPKAKGGVDGFNFWGDVDKQTKDKSPFGVIGMAGNVSEWTADWAQEKYPIVKGGNFTIGLQPMGARIINKLPGDQEEFIGFRTISRKDPAAKNATPK